MLQMPPNYPYQQPMPQYCMPQACAPAKNTPSSQYNAVNIQLIEPHVKAAPEYNPAQYQQPVYNYPSNNIYDGGFGGQYPYAAPQMPMAQAPFVMPQAPMVPPQAPVATPPQPQSIIPPSPQPPVQQAPNQTIINQQPAPQEIQPQQAVVQPQPVQQPVAPTIEPPQQLPGIDIGALVTRIKSNDLNTQGKAIEEIGNVIEKNPAAGTQYLDTSLVNSLVDAVNQDTTALAGPTPQQIELRQKLMTGQQLAETDKATASQLSPMELGERNKQYAIYTIAMLQDTLAKEVEKANGTKLAISDLPAIEPIVQTVKSNPNPMLRASGLAALSYISKPEYTPVLSEVFRLAQDDIDPTVQAVAKEALNKLNPAAPAPEQAPAKA